jgi:hypothetical protein
MSQLEGVAEVSARQRRIAKFVEGQPPQGDMDPQVLVAGREGVAEGVACSFGIAGSPDLEALLQVGLRFSDAPGVNELVVRLGDASQADGTQARAGMSATVAAGGTRSRTHLGGLWLWYL